MELTKRCLRCDHVFRVPATLARQKYCSRACYWDSTRTPVTREELDYWYNGLGENSEQIGKRLGISGRTVRDLMERAGLRRRNKAQAAIDYPRRPFSKDPDEAAYMLGFRAGDLNVRIDLETSETIHVRCSTTRQAQVDLIRQLFQQYGHIHCRHGSLGETQVECHLDLSFDFLLLKPRRLPSQFREERNLFWEFLAGYFDAEGYIPAQSAARPSSTWASLETGDVGILRDLHHGLVEEGIACHFRLRKPAGTVYPNGKRLTRDIYTLHITRKAAALQFLSNLEPRLRHADKRVRLTQAMAVLRLPA